MDKGKKGEEGVEAMPIFHFVQPCNRKRSHWTFNVCSRHIIACQCCQNFKDKK